MDLVLFNLEMSPDDVIHRQSANRGRRPDRGSHRPLDVPYVKLVSDRRTIHGIGSPY